jgi:hypothetical protein
LDILQQLKKDYNFKLINYPGENGVMSHQLNYAIKEISRNEQKEFLLGFYNVDSKISPKILNQIYNSLMKDSESVFQQYSYYTYNEPSSFEEKILVHLSLWQSRWALHFELGRVLLSNKLKWLLSLKLLKLFRSFHYVIGHGLFFSYQTWVDSKEFPEDQINEDACFGLKLYILNKKIKPINSLEKADFAERISIYSKQQSVWFNGPLFAFNYLDKDLREKNFSELVNALMGSLKLFSHALYWIGGPIFIYSYLFYLIIYCPISYSLVWFLLIIYHSFFLNILTHRTLDKLGYHLPKTSGLFYGLGAYLLHAWGPMLCLYKTISGKNTISNKYKTEKMTNTR